MTHDEAQQMVATEGRVTDFMGDTQGTIKGWTTDDENPDRDAVFVLWDGDRDMSTELVDDLWVAPTPTPGP